MALYDTIYVAPDDSRFGCPTCSVVPLAFQTYDMYSELSDFYLVGDDLFKLGDPRESYRIDYSRKDLEDMHILAFPLLRTGYYPEEAFYPKNRDKSIIGDGLPHGWFSMGMTCKGCSTWFEFSLKFTDGKLVEVKRGS